MSYAEQLTLLVLIGFGTLTWKVAVAVARERRETENLPPLTTESSLNNSTVTNDTC